MRAGALSAVFILASSSTFSGCFEVRCDPEPPEVTVSLAAAEETFRALPIVASGRTELVGEPVPDSHGHLAVRTEIDGVDDVTITSLDLSVAPNDEDLDIRIERQMANDKDVEERDALAHDERLRFFYRARRLADLLQPIGAPYAGTVTLGWRRDFAFCPSQSGIETVTVNGEIANVIDADVFELDALGESEAAAPLLAGTAQFKLAAVNAAAEAMDIDDVTASVTYLGADGLVPGIGLALFSASDVASSEQEVPAGAGFEIHSSADGASYGSSGVAATVGSIAGGKAVMQVAIRYRTAGSLEATRTDTLVHAVDVR